MALINELNGIGNAIREKTGGTDLIPLKEMANAIRNISGGGSSGAELNIAYGDNAPDDTSKLWIKANEPQSIVFDKNLDGVESIEILTPTLPSILYSFGCARVGNKIYIFGGSYNGYKDTIYVFDIDAQTLSQLSVTLPTTNSELSCATVGTKIYLFGGYNGSYLNTISVFDTVEQTITTLDVTLPTVLSSSTCSVLDNKIYLFGGSTTSKAATNSIIMFDTDNQTVSTLSTTFPSATRGIACARVNDKIYLFGGRGGSSTSTRNNKIMVFDTKTQTLATLSATLPEVRCYTNCVSVGSKIYIFGGEGGGYNTSTSLNTICIFDTETQTIQTIDEVLPKATSSMGCDIYGCDIYLLGGMSLNTINKFSITHELAENNIEVVTGFKNYFNVVNTGNMKVQVGIDSVLIGNAENQAKNCDAFLHNGTDWQQI